jgi:hypothetical protein
MVLQVMRLKWNLDSVRLEIVLILTQMDARFASNVPQAQKSIWMHPMELLGGVVHMESHFGMLRDSVTVGAG